MKGLKLQSVQLLHAAVSSSISSQIRLFRYSSDYKTFSPLWEYTYTSDYHRKKTRIPNALICNQAQEGVVAVTAPA